MAWLAVDRALSAAAANSLPAPVVRWQATRDAIRAWVLEHGWHARLQAFRQSADSDEVDAANVLVPLVGFLPADDPRSRSNLDRIVAELGEDGLLHRFRADEGAFTTCSFWLVSALAWDGRTDAAAATFERLLGRASPLGLYAEELEPSTGALLGNMPQAFPHAALITAAVNLARSSEEHGVAPASADAPAGAAHLVPRRESYSSSPT
jgi:GH15 family glucan-1,4-alpha-glucosidase